MPVLNSPENVTLQEDTGRLETEYNITCLSPEARPPVVMTIYLGNYSTDAILEYIYINNSLAYRTSSTVAVLKRDLIANTLKCCYVWMTSEPVCSKSRPVDIFCEYYHTKSN